MCHVNNCDTRQAVVVLLLLLVLCNCCCCCCVTATTSRAEWAFGGRKMCYITYNTHMIYIGSL
jgi:hypothetical protein